jgi:hypothetical protein
VSRGGKLMTTSLSYLKVQRVALGIKCKLKSTIKNDIIRKTMILKNMIKK